MTQIGSRGMPGWGDGKCFAPVAGAKAIVVQQVLGERQVQEAIDIHVHVPQRKPAIEQIIDVFVKRLCITCVDVLHDKVVVRGEFEVKGLYVACKPRQPVHAVEVWPVRFTAYADIRGVRRGMEADASATVEFVDYDVGKHTRAYWHKQQHTAGHCHEDEPDCASSHECDCGYDYKACCHKPKSLKKHKCKPYCKPHQLPCHCTRHFHVTVVLGITVKVVTDRELVLHQPQILPYKPKG